jgi:anti-sigma factor RsiW
MSDRELPPESPISGDTISETELHAWIDGELPAERCSAVTVYLASHPEIAARMRRHRQQMQLMRRAFEPLLDRPQPRGVLALLAAGSRGVLWRRRAVTGLAAACLAAFLLAAGWLAHRAMPGDNYVAEAVTAYRLAVIDRAANGVWAITPEGLPGTLERLSRRVGVPLKVPALADQGFTITSGRLVPASSGATAAQFIYQRGSGQQLTIYVRPTENRGDSDVLVSRHSGGLVVCSWEDEGIAWVLVTDASMPDLMAVASNVYTIAAAD